MKMEEIERDATVAQFSFSSTVQSCGSTYKEQELARRALTTAEILEAVLEKMDVRSLLVCRCVSSYWNCEANRILKGQVKVRQLKSQKMLDDFEETLQSAIEGISLPVRHLYIYRIGKLGNLRYSLDTVRHQIKVVEWIVVHWEWSSVGEMTQLIYTVLSNLETLNIAFDGPCCSNNVPKHLTEITQKYSNKVLPALKNLSLGIPTEKPGNSQKTVCAFHKMLVASAVNLKCLNLTFGCTDQDIFSSVTSSRVEKIELRNYCRCVNNIKALLTYHLHFPLTILKLEIDSEGDLESLLKRFGDSLVQLHLRIDRRRMYFNFPPICMKKLRVLQLASCVMHFWIDWSIFPQLKRLELDECSLNGIVTPMLTCSSHASQLETLYIDIVRPISDLHPLVDQMLSHVNSQLTSLKLSVRHDWTPQLALFFKECSRLKHLSLFVETATADQQLCGVEKLASLFVNWPEERGLEETRLVILYDNLVAHAKRLHFDPSFRKFSFIGDLQDLQILKLRGDFTELAVLHGVVHCRNLTKLDLFSKVMSEKRAIGSIQQAGLVHLTSVKINGQFANHLA